MQSQSDGHHRKVDVVRITLEASRLQRIMASVLLGLSSGRKTSCSCCWPCSARFMFTTHRNRRYSAARVSRMPYTEDPQGPRYRERAVLHVLNQDVTRELRCRSGRSWAGSWVVELRIAITVTLVSNTCLLRPQQSRPEWRQQVKVAWSQSDVKQGRLDEPAERAPRMPCSLSRDTGPYLLAATCCTTPQSACFDMSRP